MRGDNRLGSANLDSYLVRKSTPQSMKHTTNNNSVSSILSLAFPPHPISSMFFYYEKGLSIEPLGKRYPLKLNEALLHARKSPLTTLRSCTEDSQKDVFFRSFKADPIILFFSS
jgi:hypothetical protein